ncbi:MAG: alpha/beta hydrolase [Thermotogota bacterium]
MIIQRKIGIFLLLFFLIAFSGFVAWGTNTMAAQDMAKDAMKGTKNVQVMTDDTFIEFLPVEGVNKGVIFYPGAKVAIDAYAPIALELAKEGILTIIVPMPLNLAIFGSNKALTVMEKYPDIESWSLAGHSLGGAMACKFCVDHPGMVDRLILLAAYTTKSFDLSNAKLPVLSITGSNDGLSTTEKIENNKEFLPPDTVYVEIEGGNHSQFGDYGDQFGDGEAQITRSEQIEIVVERVLIFLEG